MTDEIYSLRTDVDELKNLFAEFEEKIIERDHPVGSPYFTFLKDDDPNERYPGTRWVLLDEDTYLVSAGENRVGASPVGSNNQSVRIDYQHRHISRVHWKDTFISGENMAVVGSTAVTASNTQTMGSGRIGIDGTRNDSTGVGTPTIGLTGNMTSATQSFDNRPKSIAIYMWRRTA